jgi:hypothetical protein
MMRTFRKKYKNPVVWTVIISMVLSVVFSLLVSLASFFVK